jgi:hypothetical protein
MANPDLHSNEYSSTYVERDRVSRTESSGTGIAFIVGGLVVAALVLFWLFAGGDTAPVATGTDAGDVSVSVEGADAPAAQTATPDAAAPAAGDDAAAPAETAPAAPVENN